MPSLSFSKWSPSGNTTLLFPAEAVPVAAQADVACQALQCQVLEGEQAGFHDLKARRLRMSGGEFCVNATRALGALLASGEPAVARELDMDGRPVTPAARDEYQYDVQVSGWQTPVHLRVRGRMPVWQVAADLILPNCPVQQVAPGAVLVRLPGIAHLLLDASHPFPDDYLAASSLLRQEFSLDTLPACGIIWWRQVQQQLEMMPVVHVRDAGTTFLENACGSGSLALGLRLCPAGEQRHLAIRQPGGLLDVHVDRRATEARATVDGPVQLVAQGRLWLPDKNR